ncbi:DUF5665 domain-containing protein [Paenibacillus senegalensis]|uniref:DUF5665 domain-containing protein n=1 Tax=Paenibacillus senegalensis TaxID=1465766 RepID=UPI00028A09C8|nr:DUF5665 domain-containing protein [Paenibacillus senegalensis]
MAKPNDDNNEQNRMIAQLIDRIDKLAFNLEKARFAEYVQLIENPKRLLFNHLIGGVARGVGIAIGFTLLTSTLVYVLQALGALDLPIIGDYIAEIVKQVQAQLNGRPY